jgi:D-arginine utilization repressor
MEVILKQSLQEALPFAEAFSRLLHPFAEVVVHDLAKDQIEAIYNPISRREVGDDSYLDRVDMDDAETIIGPYEKTNWDGRALKSISIVLRNQLGKAEGVLCVNVDISAFESVNQLLQSFLKNNAEIPEDSQHLFKDDLYERINLYVQNYCRERQVGMDALGRGEKREIINSLAEDGAFQGKNAANYVARVLGISRATVYNYLKERDEA